MSTSAHNPIDHLIHDRGTNAADFLPKEMADLMNLSDKERRIFEVLGKLQMGARAKRIATASDLPLTTTAYILRKLEKRQLVRGFQIAGKRDLWACARRLKNGQLAKQMGGGE